MGSRSPSTQKVEKAPIRGKKVVPRELPCRLELGTRKKREVRSGTARLTSETLRFHTGRTGREGRDFALELRFETLGDIEVLEGTLAVQTEEGDRYVFDLGKHAAAWAELMKKRPGLLALFGVGEELTVDALTLPDEELTTALADVPRATGAVDLFFVPAEHKRDLENLATHARRLRPGGGLWVIFPTGPRGLAPIDVAKAGRAQGLAPGNAIILQRDREALKFVVAEVTGLDKPEL